MKLKLVIAMFSLLLAGCIHENARFNRQIVGSWSLNVLPNPATFSWKDPVICSWTISSDGSFVQRLGHTSHLVTYQGTWRVEDERLLLTFTNAFGVENYKPAPVVGTVHQCKIMDIDDHRLVILAPSGQTNTFVR